MVAFVTVIVEEHDELPEGCCMRFKVVDEPRAVRRVRYDGDGGELRAWVVESPGSAVWGVTVEDSGAGSCVLVYGGERGLRLRPEGGGEAVAEAYLLMAGDAVG
jgi:hypothetical protein